MKGVAVGLVLAGMVMLVAVAEGADVTVDFDRSADLSRCGKYAWRAGDATAQDPLVHKRIVAAVEAALSRKGSWRWRTRRAAT